MWLVFILVLPVKTKPYRCRFALSSKPQICCFFSLSLLFSKMAKEMRAARAARLFVLFGPIVSSCFAVSIAVAVASR